VAAETIWNQSVNPGGTSNFTGTLGTAFTLSQAAPLTGIWYPSVAGAASLASACAIYDVNSQTVVSGTLNSSPSWSGAAGSGWVKCSYPGTTTLNASQAYIVACYFSALTGFSSGFTWPVMSGIIDATADQSVAGGSIAFPGTVGGAFSHFIDVEVTPVVLPPVPMYYSMRSFP
jgi:hypothetical protein